PVVAAGVEPDVPAAVFVANRVVACTAAARAAGVRRHMRRREASRPRRAELWLPSVDGTVVEVLPEPVPLRAPRGSEIA
ncbi:MAG TPA: hypothetical protein VLR27_04730, partial [Acidimicrobiales bacterium]|nr:hypothetical protein [Acidimicrobiales bacterium]